MGTGKSHRHPGVAWNPMFHWAPSGTPEMGPGEQRWMAWPKKERGAAEAECWVKAGQKPFYHWLCTNQDGRSRGTNGREDVLVRLRCARCNRPSPPSQEILWIRHCMSTLWARDSRGGSAWGGGLCSADVGTGGRDPGARGEGMAGRPWGQIPRRPLGGEFDAEEGPDVSGRSTGRRGGPEWGRFGRASGGALCHTRLCRKRLPCMAGVRCEARAKWQAARGSVCVLTQSSTWPASCGGGQTGHVLLPPRCHSGDPWSLP